MGAAPELVRRRSFAPCHFAVPRQRGTKPLSTPALLLPRPGATSSTQISTPTSCAPRSTLLPAPPKPPALICSPLAGAWRHRSSRCALLPPPSDAYLRPPLLMSLRPLFTPRAALPPRPKTCSTRKSRSTTRTSLVRTHPPTHLPTYPPTRPLIRAPTHPPIYPRAHPPLAVGPENVNVLENAMGHTAERFGMQWSLHYRRRAATPTPLRRCPSPPSQPRHRLRTAAAARAIVSSAHLLRRAAAAR